MPPARGRPWLAGLGRGLLSCLAVDELSKLIPIRRGEDSQREAPRLPSAGAVDWTPRQPEAPWRLAAVEEWFARARQAGFDTIAERRRARLADERERLAPLGRADKEP